MNCLILFKLPILFTTVKLRVGHKLSQFIHKLKIGIFDLVLGRSSKCSPIHKEIFRFVTSQEKDGKLGDLNISLGGTSKMFPIRQSILSDCEDSISDTVGCRRANL